MDRVLRAFAALALAAFAAPLFAHHTAEKPVVGQAWVREVIPGQEATAAYLVIESRDHEADALIGASCDAAGTVEIHTMKNQAGMMVMKKLDRLPLAPGGKIVLAPGGNHLMLFGLKRDLRAGDHVRLKLTFQAAGEVEVDASVKAQELENHAHR